ncbi:MAG: bifunctional demethylmenaquinone methyltransferase/2-methoxy-6-polyprenyl-1,4-benzoquinol methylase UbiE [Pseudomonadota bacterium]|nr:bifunctional demethylmenaquinone methyltransferase/2-methoxy-6-polyprenyl-1,4-benzoquinol methylase UbiE [Pseudomonadota bacterium]
MEENSDITDFGFEKVTKNDKSKRVRGVFDSVAPSYDSMNDIMSFGIHRAWKSFLLSQTCLHDGDTALDIASGTGDLTESLASKVGNKGKVFLTDINASMLNKGRDRLFDKCMLNNINYLQVDAENLPFKNNSIKCVSIAFGLRNVTNKLSVLQEMNRVLCPGGRALILEFSKPILKFLEPAYDLYSFQILPGLGELIADDADSYRYLAESIRMHPNQQSLKNMMISAGLEDCHYYNLSGGIVALHVGYRY